MIIQKNNINNLLKNKRLRAQNDSNDEKSAEIKIKENNGFSKNQNLNYKASIFKKEQKNNKTKKRLNFEELKERSEGEPENKIKYKKKYIETEKINIKNRDFHIFLKRTSNRRNIKKIDYSLKKNYSKDSVNIKNITPVKTSKNELNLDSNYRSGKKKSYSTLVNNRQKRSIKKNSFENIQDSIRLKKSRSISSSSRSSSFNSIEHLNEISKIKTRNSPRLENKSLVVKKLNEKLKYVNKESKKIKILKKQSVEPIKSPNRELKSLDKIHLSLSNSRIGTPEKSKSPLKNLLLSGIFLNFLKKLL